MIIRRTQIDTWFQHNEPAFVNTILQRVRELHPTYRQTDEMLRDSIRSGIQRARRNRLTSDRHISEFVLIMFETAPNFDQQKDIRRTLDDDTVPTEQRWERLFTPALDKAWAEADDPSFYDADAWFDQPPKDISEVKLPTEQEWSEIIAQLRIQQQTPQGQAVRDPTPEEIERARADIERVAAKKPPVR